MVRRYYKDYCRKAEDSKIKKELEKSRIERRRRVRDDDLPESQLCVVCRSNPREVTYFQIY